MNWVNLTVKSTFGRRSRGGGGQSSDQRHGGQVHHHGALLGIAQQRGLPDGEERAPADHRVHGRPSGPEREGEEQKKRREKH